MDAGGKRSTAVGRATQVNGRSATIALQTNFQQGRIHLVKTIGKDAPTNAEVMRGDVVLKALQGVGDIMKSPFVRKIWLPKETVTWDGIPSSPLPVSLYFPGTRVLNPSQEKAINIILSNHDANRVALIQGPPGTGKTTVIAAAVTSIMASRDSSRTLWLIAQSNVAVKNIAGKLVDVDFLDFKLLVSRDFHFDWSAHLPIFVL
jgi:regulator of nonsense transcripts 1